MKLINPNSQNEARQWVDDHKGAVQTYLENNSNRREIHFDTIREDIPLLKGDGGRVPDGWIRQLLQEIGAEVVDE